MHLQSLTLIFGISYITKHNFLFELQNCFLNSKFISKYITLSPPIMTVPTNISETPMVHTKHKSLHRSKGMNISIPMEICQHVLKTVMGIMDDEQIESISHWMFYRGFYTFTKICDQLYCISDDI